MDRQQRYLVVGLGSIGRRHLANLRTLRPQGSIAALRHSDRIDSGADAPDLTFTSQADALEFGPDAVIVASPAPFHVEVARAFLAAGVPVLIEKPLAVRIEGAQDLAAIANSTATPAMVGYNLRFEQAVQKMRALVADGTLGEIRLARGYVGQYLPDWRPGQDYRAAVSARHELGGGPLLELSHEIDLACWLFGLPAIVHCRGGRLSDLEIDVEDAVELVLEYENPSRLVTLGLNFLDRSPTRRLDIVGSEATATWDGIARQVRVAPGGGRDVEMFDFAEGDRNEAYLAELDHFLTCAEDRCQPMITIADGMRALAVVEAARRSMRSGTGVRMQDIR